MYNLEMCYSECVTSMTALNEEHGVYHYGP